QITDILGEIASPDVMGRTGNFDFPYRAAQGTVTVKVESIAGQVQLDIVPGGGAVASAAAPQLAAPLPSAGPSVPEPMAASAPAPAAPIHSPVSQPRSGAPVIERYFMTMVDQGASDLHLCSKNPPLYRKDGDIVTIGETEPLSPEEVQKILLEITPDQNR